MPYYLVQTAYTQEAMANLLKKPENRTEAIRPVLEKLGGKVQGAWLAFGEYDVVAIFQMPDNVSAAAISMAISASGATKAVKTTPLITWQEGVQAMRKAAKSGYKPPSK